MQCAPAAAAKTHPKHHHLAPPSPLTRLRSRRGPASEAAGAPRPLRPLACGSVLLSRLGREAADTSRHLVTAATVTAAAAMGQSP